MNKDVNENESLSPDDLAF